MRTRGKFIVFEGPDGAGKTTQMRAAAARLRELGKTALTTAQPTSGPIGQLIRRIITGEDEIPGAEGKTTRAEMLALLFAADRRAHNEWIYDRLYDGADAVLCDRHLMSSIIYQTMSYGYPYSHGNDELLSRRALGTMCFPGWLHTIQSYDRAPEASRHEANLKPEPDLILVFNASDEVLAQRLKKRGTAADEFELSALQTQVAAAYRNEEVIREMRLSKRIEFISTEPDVLAQCSNDFKMTTDLVTMMILRELET